MFRVRLVKSGVWCMYSFILEWAARIDEGVKGGQVLGSAIVVSRSTRMCPGQGGE